MESSQNNNVKPKHVFVRVEDTSKLIPILKERLPQSANVNSLYKIKCEYYRSWRKCVNHNS